MTRRSVSPHDPVELISPNYVWILELIGEEFVVHKMLLGPLVTAFMVWSAPLGWLPAPVRAEPLEPRAELEGERREAEDPPARHLTRQPGPECRPVFQAPAPLARQRGPPEQPTGLTVLVAPHPGLKLNLPVHLDPSPMKI